MRLESRPRLDRSSQGNKSKYRRSHATVIVLITLPTNIDIIFVRIILMWNNDGVDYDHVDAGNQERDELGKEVFNKEVLNTDTGSNFC